MHLWIQVSDCCPFLATVFFFLPLVCSNGLPCDGENEECDADGNCGCVDGFVRDQTGHCVEGKLTYRDES